MWGQHLRGGIWQAITKSFNFKEAFFALLKECRGIESSDV